MKRLIAGLAIVLGLAGCGKDISSGNITRKDFQPAHVNTYFVPIMSTSCGGNPISCHSFVVGMIPMEDHVPDQWFLALEACKPGDVGEKPKCDRGTAKVTHEVFDQAEIGMHYDKKLGLS